ncbi:NtaA/DmoA family FMN-dependent monooxygenase [Streptomyces sp. NPDC005761]|uniref:NtaA/DmoA family FMN-dependent monooxygenase n=1 Tax=unclassified Streptomyces TaxID=2593676 RepID=UPI0033DE1982
MTAAPPRQMHLAAHFPADDTAVWNDPRSGSQVEFASFEHLARTAERGLFDFFLLAEGLRLREDNGLVRDLDVAGRPEPLTVLAALSAVTQRLGLAATVSPGFHEPYEPARRLATLDHLSAGRAAWNVVTSSGPLTGENFRNGGHRDRAGSHARTAEFVATARALWDSWTPDGTPAPFAHRSRHFRVEGEFTVPRSPQGHPVVIGTGDSSQDREFAASAADVVLARLGTPEAGRAFCADVKERLARYGREPGELKVMAGAGVVLGDSDAEARERAAAIRLQQVSPQHAIRALEQVWGRDLSSYDPDGPLPEWDPEPAAELVGARHGEALAVAARWRELSRTKGLSIRQTVIEATGRQPFVGSPETVAAEMTGRVATGAADGFVLVPHLVPGGLDDFVDRVVPLLQERGVFRGAYTGSTLRSHLGLAEPVWKG